jgi:hypothetical protein
VTQPDEETRREAWRRLSGLRVLLGISLALWAIIWFVVVQIINWF